MKFSTKGRNGKNSKAIHVETNDPANLKFNLNLTGEVRKFVTITPSKAYLRGKVGEKISQIVTVVPDAKEPFKILNLSVLHGVDFRYSMEETEIDGKKVYQFLIENTKMSAGEYLDQITILTDKPEHNPVTIIVNGVIRSIGPKNKGAGDAQPPPN